MIASERQPGAWVNKIIEVKEYWLHGRTAPVIKVVYPFGESVYAKVGPRQAPLSDSEQTISLYMETGEKMLASNAVLQVELGNLQEGHIHQDLVGDIGFKFAGYANDDLNRHREWSV